MRNEYFLFLVPLITFNAMIFPFAAFATIQKILPSFTQQWYQTATDTGFSSACGIHRYNYTNMSKDIDPIMAAQLPSYPDCTWRVKEKLPSLNPMAPDFPGKMDYIKFYPLITQIWTVNCVNIEGTVLHSQWVIAFPRYRCLDNTRLGNGDGGYDGCFVADYPQVCTADIAGREKENDPGFHFGHIGLIFAERGGYYPAQQSVFLTFILEAKGYFKSIQSNELKDFIDDVPGGFWGVKYQVKNVPEINEEQAKQIIYAGGNEYLLNPGYTLLPTYESGGIKDIWIYVAPAFVQQRVSITPLFRCDTFVYYCYLIGAGIKIFDPIVFMTPYKVFNGLEKDRGVKDIGYIKGMLRKIFSNQDKESKIKEIFSAPAFAIDDADNVVMDYLNDQSFERIRKINFLWSLIALDKTNQEKFVYLNDALKQLKPVELVNELIAAYKGEQDNVKKLKLVELMTTSIQYEDKEDTDKLTKDQIQNIITIQDFLKIIIDEQCKGNKESQQTICAAVSGLSSEILKNKSGDLFDENEPFNAESYHDKLLIQLPIALSTQKMQETYLRNLLTKNAAQHNLQKQQLFIRMLAFLLTKYPSSGLSDSIRDELKSLLLDNKAILMDFPISNLGISLNIWLEAYATVMCHDEAQKNQFQASYIVEHQNDNLLEAAVFIEHAKKEVLDKIDSSARVTLIKSMENFIENNKNDYKNNDWLRSIIYELKNM